MRIEKLVPDLVQIKRKALEMKMLQGLILKKKSEIHGKLLREFEFLRAEYFTKENKKKKNLNLLQNRSAKKNNKFIISSKAKILFVIRIRGINGINPRTKKILQLLRLNQINNGVFLKINSSTNQMLKKIEPFVAYGFPSLKSIRNLIGKRGYGKIGKRGSWQRIFLSNENVIEQGLGGIGISTVEEIIDELFNCGPHFKEINNFIWPFQLKSPKKGYSTGGKTRHFIEGGAYGNWEETINQLIQKMN